MTRVGRRCSISTRRYSAGPKGTTATEKGNPLILYTGELGQFLYLLPAKDEFMVTPNMDHFGLEVSSKEEMLEILERVRNYQAQGRSSSPDGRRCHGDPLWGQGVHTLKRIHLVPDPAMDRTPTHRATLRRLTQHGSAGVRAWRRRVHTRRGERSCEASAATSLGRPRRVAPRRISVRAERPSGTTTCPKAFPLHMMSTVLRVPPLKVRPLVLNMILGTVHLPSRASGGGTNC